MNTVAPLWLWFVFVAIVLVALFVDFVVLRKQGAHDVGVKEALNWSIVWVLLSFAFNGLLWWAVRDAHGIELANAKGLEFLTGYLIEKSLAVDNIFVFLMIFTYFAVPPAFQKRVLMIGILGAIVLRTLMILAGAWLIQHFHWILYVFGAFLVLTGIKMWLAADHMPDIANNPVLKFLRKRMRVTPTLRGNAFFVREPQAPGGAPVLWATPLFLALCLVEFADLIFAVDSVPAIFAITTDPFIVYTSNIFAILGLRALYFALAAMIHRFVYLKYALALVLVFIGSKIFLVNLVGKFPPLLSLSVTAALIAGGVLVSLWKTRGQAATSLDAPDSPPSGPGV